MMKKALLFSVFICLGTGLLSCNNPASDPNNESSEVHESMAAAGDTVNQHTTGFTTAMHQMMNDMRQLPMTGNVDKDFALMMRSHHQGAVDMSQFEISNGKDDSLKELAVEISEEQKREIKKLEVLIAALDKAKKNYDPKKKEEGFAKVMNDSMHMMGEMAKMDTNMATDHQFVAMMIPHHQSAVYMAEGFLKHGKNDQLLQMAMKMIASQKKEIDAFESWMDKHKE
jgi:uncharacterized protein (DUF305 family)